ncbi:MAG TPA: amidohydrolase [Chloroflexota bacterium]|nr:amidohydrolase [Chloroflexota bacterium]
MAVPEQVDLVIRNGLVITLNPMRTILTNASIAVQAGRIVAVGKTAELDARYRGRETLDATDKIVMPGLIDAHLHTNEGPRGFVPDDIPAMPWIREWIRPIFAALDPDDEYLLSLLVLCEALKTGTTMFCEGGTIKYPESIAAAVQETGIRANIGRWTWDAVTEPRQFYRTPEQALHAYEDLIREFHGAADGRISVWVHLAGAGAVSDTLLVGAKQLADRHGIGISMHQSLTEEEVALFVARHGRRPMEHFEALGVLDRNTRFIHMVALSDHEVDLIKRYDVKVVHCVMTAMKLGYGATAIGKFPEMIERGVTVALGCDGANCSNTFDMFRAMFCVAGVHKDSRRDVRCIAAETALEMATINGAKSLLMDHMIGSLEVGKCADIVLCDRKQLQWLPIANVINNLVYSADGRSVDTVIVDGRIVVRNGRVVTVDEEALYDRVSRVDWVALMRERAGLPLRCRWPVV